MKRIVWMSITAAVTISLQWAAIACGAETEPIASSTPSPAPASTPSSTPVATSMAQLQLPTELIRGCQQDVGRDQHAPLPGELAIDFTLKDIHGTEYTLSRLLAEKPVVMIFGSFT